MVDTSKKILITSALPYVNNVPHLGNIYGCVLPADVFARFSRSMGCETLFVCGADEHGTATQTKARQEGLSPQALCDKYYKLHKDIYEWFSISFDVFGRTSTPAHHELTRNLFKQVLDNGFIEEQTRKQPFCTSCDSFLADRFIQGTCPYCGFEDARGDQCDSCGKLLTPQELQNPRCKEDGTQPEFRDTKHLFLRLDSLQPVLEEWVKTSSKDTWTTNALHITNAWFKEGLQQRAITRDLKWGISLPKDVFNGTYKDKVFYVWFDAPIGYISITKELLGEAYKQWWEDNDNVELVQFMGKDNVPFHSIIFPATLLAADNIHKPQQLSQAKHTLVSHLAVSDYLNYEHTKFSKSKGVGVFGDNAQQTGLPADIFRYVLMYYWSSQGDAQFTWKALQERVNNELVANFGNLVNRTISFINRFTNSKVEPLTHADLDQAQEEFYDNFQHHVKEYIALLSKVKLRDALHHFLRLSSLANQFFQEREPWKTKTTNKNQCEKDLSLLAHTVKDLAILIQPYMPQTSQHIFSQLNTGLKDMSDVGKFSLASKKAHGVGEAQLLFNKIEDEKIQELQQRFGGVQMKDTQVATTQKKESSNTSSTNLASSDVELRVGKIIDVKKHPNADKLYIEHVDFGDHKRQIVSGLVGHYTPEELQDKQVIVVTNLKAAKLRGEKSQGMLLAAQDSAGVVGLLLAPQAPLGARVLAGMDAPAKEEISIDEFATLAMKVENEIPYLNEGKMDVQGGLIIDKIKNGSIQ